MGLDRNTKREAYRRVDAIPFESEHKFMATLNEGPDGDRLLLETDAPYLAPLPWRGKRNEPAYTVFTVRAMAEARGENPEDLWRTCGDNARRFFGI